MSIVTKTGDAGKTSLFTGEKVWKDDVRVEAYATVDELDSFLGLSRHFVSEEISLLILDIQKKLYRVCSELASTDSKGIDTIKEDDVKELEEKIAVFESRIPLKGFVIPGTTKASGFLDACRTIARRAERRIVALNRENVVSPILRKFVNRLSDTLYMMARNEEVSSGGPISVKNSG